MCHIAACQLFWLAQVCTSSDKKVVVLLMKAPCDSLTVYFQANPMHRFRRGALHLFHGRIYGPTQLH
jgi:hypothetical protein